MSHFFDGFSDELLKLAGDGSDSSTGLPKSTDTKIKVLRGLGVVHDPFKSTDTTKVQKAQDRQSAPLVGSGSSDASKQTLKREGVFGVQ